MQLVMHSFNETLCDFKWISNLPHLGRWWRESLSISYRSINNCCRTLPVPPLKTENIYDRVVVGILKIPMKKFLKLLITHSRQEIYIPEATPLPIIWGRMIYSNSTTINHHHWLHCGVREGMLAKYYYIQVIPLEGVWERVQEEQEDAI